MPQLKVMTILGTRPEIIRLSRVIARLDKHVNHCLVHTGQNYDHALNEIFFEEMGLRRPDRYLDAGRGTLAETLAGILIGSERVIREVQPDAVLVLGDTNSAISAVMARRLKVPIYHMEAGNRSFDRNVPEETNRRVVDHIADFNLVYTESARRHLVSEGIPHRRIYLTGSPMREVIDHYRDGINASRAMAELRLAPRQFIMVSIHREENVDHSARLASLLDTLGALASRYEMPIVVSTHPRTRKRLDRHETRPTDARIRFMPPFGFLDYCQLQANAYCVVSDSGTVAEESCMLGFPAVTPRDAIERPEALDAGCVIMTGIDRDTILECISAVTEMHALREKSGQARSVPVEYTITNTSERVVSLILGTARLSNLWDGIRVNDLT